MPQGNGLFPSLSAALFAAGNFCLDFVMSSWYRVSNTDLRRRFRGILSVAVMLSAMADAYAEDRSFRIGAAYRAELKQPYVANWRSIELRDVLQRVSADRRLAILLDRRIDPNQQVPVSFGNDPLRDSLASLAGQFHGEASFADNVVVLGPEQVTGKLRTLIALRRQELESDRLEIPAARRALWLKPRTVDWDDLTAPSEILDRLQTAGQFQLRQRELVEHDLWAAAELPQVTLIDALSIVLIQFDLTFAFQPEGESVELAPVPERVQVERSHKPKGKSAETWIESARSRFPQAEFRVEGKEVFVLATVEEQELLEAGTTVRVGDKPPPGVQPLSRRQFTLKIKDVSARDLMAELEKSGLRFVYDPQELSRARVNLDQLIQLDVRKLSAAEFFRTVFDPLQVDCTLDGVTVKLTPK